MKPTHFITATLIFSTLTLTSLNAARRSSPTSSTKSTSTNSTKGTAKKLAHPAKKKKTAKIPVQSETASQKSAKKKTSSLTTSQKSKLLDLLNEGTGRELDAIKGIAKVRSESIIKARPFRAIDELILVKGIGETTFARVIEHAKTLPRKKSTSQKSSSTKSRSKKMAAS